MRLNLFARTEHILGLLLYKAYIVYYGHSKACYFKNIYIYIV